MKGQLYGAGLGPPYYVVREVAMGHKDDAISARASGRDLDKLTVAEASQAIQKMFVPANAVLSLAGDLHGLDIETLTAHLFGDIPAGQRLAHSRPRRSRPSRGPCGLRESHSRVAWSA